MKIHNEYNAWFKERFESYLDQYRNEKNELILPISYHNEYYYTKGSIADFTLVFISGAINQKIAQRPIQIICEVEEMYVDDFLQALDDFTYNFNEEIITLGNTKYRAYFRIPSFSQKFLDYGATRRAVITLDASIILFQNVLNVKKIEIGFTKEVEELKFSAFALTYMANTMSTGNTTTTIVNNIGNTCSNSYSISVVPKETSFFDKLADIMLSCDKPNESVYLRITLSNGRTHQALYVISNASVQEEVQSFPVNQISLVRKGVWLKNG